MMNMKKSMQQYVKQVKKYLICGATVKAAILAEIKARLLETYANSQELSLQTIYDEFGTPQEVASSFYDKANTAEIKKRIRRIQWIAIGVFVVAAFVLCVGIILIANQVNTYTVISSY